MLCYLRDDPVFSSDKIAMDLVWLVAETFASPKSFFMRIVVYLVSLAILLTLARADPGGFVGWFLD